MARKINRTPYRASRAVTLAADASGRPASLDEATRSVGVIASTEAPALVMDWGNFEVVREVLLMSGCRLPAAGQVPLLDSHSRESVARVLGSFRAPGVQQTEYGPALVGRSHFSAVREADDAFVKVREGHLTDVSIGYEVLEHIWLREGESMALEGRTYTGPLRIGTQWALAELSLCPIGADSNAKIRAAGKAPARQTPPAQAAGNKKENGNMAKEKKAGGTPAKKEKRAGLIARLRSLLGLRAEDDTEEERQDIQLVDADGNPIEVADLSEEELIAAVEELDAALAEAEAELEGAEGEDEAADEAAAPAEGAKAARAAGNKFARFQHARAAQIERGRINGIRNLAASFDLAPEMENQLIESGTSLVAAKAQVLDMVNKRSKEGFGPGFSVEMGQPEQEKFRSAAQDALSLRCGHKVEKPATGAQELHGYSLREIAREMLLRSGQRPQGNVVQLVGRALATTDLPQLLVEASRRTLMEAFETAPETWRTWCGTGVASDFKKSKAIGIEGDVKPTLKPEGAEYVEGKLAENAEEYTIATYGRKMVITREAIINDDLNALTALPRMYGEQTAEMVGDVAYAALLKAGKMGDGKALFDAAHKNIYAGKGGVPTVPNLGAMVTGMKTQKDSFGKTISIPPKFFLAPVALEVAAEQFFNTQLQGNAVIGTQASPLINNPYGGNFFARVYDRRLDDVDPDAFYLAAARNTITVYFLGGVETPFIEDQIDFNTDGVVSKVRMDVGAKAMRWVTLAKATK